MEIQKPWVLFFVVIFVSACVIAWTKWIFRQFGYKVPTEPPPVEWALGSLTQAPVGEEFWYRLMPMLIFYYCGLPHPWWLGYWIVGGPMFGIAHGTGRMFSHSISGLILAASFYGLEHNFGIIVAYIVNVIIHFTINFYFNIDYPHHED